MVGSWIDKDEDDNVTIQTDCEWTKNRNFMTRSFAVVDRRPGEQVRHANRRLGPDRQANSLVGLRLDGGYSEGKWKHKGKKWIVQQTGTLPDGGKTTATNIFTQVDDNSFTWQSINREVDGEMQPNIDEVLIVRKPTE